MKVINKCKKKKNKVTYIPWTNFFIQFSWLVLSFDAEIHKLEYNNKLKCLQQPLKNNIRFLQNTKEFLKKMDNGPDDQVLMHRRNKTYLDTRGGGDKDGLFDMGRRFGVKNRHWNDWQAVRHLPGTGTEEREIRILLLNHSEMMGWNFGFHF